MKKFWTAATVGILLLSSLPAARASKAILIPVVPVKNSTQTVIFDINDADVIVGSYLDKKGIEHGFFGTLGGEYTLFDYPHNVTGTEARAISDEGDITGTAYASGFCFGYEFLRKQNGKFVTFKKDGIVLDGIAQGITSSAVSVGDHWDSGCTKRTGYFAKAGKYQSDITLSVSAANVAARGVNSAGTIVGFFSDTRGIRHGFVQAGGTTEVVDFPSDKAVATGLQDINENGTATGGWSDAKGVSHPFTFDTLAHTFTSLNFRTLSSPLVSGLNNAGLVAVQTASGSYVYCPLKKPQCPRTAREGSLVAPFRGASRLLKNL